MPPKIIAKNADRQGGVLPVTGAARAATSKAPTTKLKLEIRRLPPGLTITEFEEALGDEWKLGNGRIDWRDYRQGKVRPAGSGKPPEQSRCYLHLISEPYVQDFERKFLETQFYDKAGTHKNPDLKQLQPALDYAPNQRTPLQQAKRRTDNRQGTIDQDPEFIAFLEAETQPITKQAALDAANFESVSEKSSDIKTTPLIEDLREKKANKAKAAQAKAEKAAEKDKKSQATKPTSKDANSSTEKDGIKSSQQSKPEPAAKGAKAQAKQNGPKQKDSAQDKAVSPVKSRKPPPSSKSQIESPVAASASNAIPAPVRGPVAQRQRGNADGIKKMLQKDLGIKPKPTTTTEPGSSSTKAPAPGTAAPSSQATQTTVAATTPKSPPTKPASVATSTAEAKPVSLKAYLKHANPSQGMTEILIQQALSHYGDVSNVTIDPRKGTAIAVFKQIEGLKKALEAKKVAVANGAVEVLEFRDRSAGGPSVRGGFRAGRGGRGGSRGGANVQSAAPVSSAPVAPS